MLLHIHHSNLIEDIDDPEEDAQSCEAWAYLTQQQKLSHAIICKVQRLITVNQSDLLPTQQGHYRSQSKVNVWVGGHVAPTWTRIDGIMDNFVLDMKDWKNKDPKEMHVRFEHAHPFADGNGRTGRMLMWWHERMLGREPTLIKFEDREKYYKWFKVGNEWLIRLLI